MMEEASGQHIDGRKGTVVDEQFKRVYYCNGAKVNVKPTLLLTTLKQQTRPLARTMQLDNWKAASASCLIQHSQLDATICLLIKIFLELFPQRWRRIL